MHYFLKFIFGIKLYMFLKVPLSIIRSFSLYTQQWYVSYRFADSLRAGSGRSWVPSWSCWQAVSITCMTHTIAVCTMNKSWWWTEEPSETCRVLFPKQIWEISVSSWFYYKNVDQVWNVADGGNGSARRMEPDPRALCAQQIPHGLAGV